MRSACRRRAAQLLPVLLALLLFAPGPVLAGFVDIEGHWAQDILENWIEAGLISGYEDGTFRPDEDVTRAEFVALVNRSFGFTERQENHFTDVPLDAWFSGHVDRAVAADYISGYEDGTFRPQRSISRQEAAYISARLQDLPAAPAETLEQFVDADAIPAWSREAIAAVVAEDLMHGYEDGTFRPEAPLTRAESVATLDRMVDEFPSPHFDAELTLDQESYQAEDTITVVVINTGETAVELGHPFQVEFEENNEWTKIELDLSWILVLEQLEPGFDFQQEFVPEEAFQEEPQPGNYRVSKEVRCTATGRALEVKDDFYLRAEP